MKKYKRCKKCIMDTTDPTIKFDGDGICSYCNYFESTIKDYWEYNKTKEESISQVINEIKARRNKKSNYDCIVGISGGVDSSYLVYRLKEWDLKPLIVHIDAGWNSELAVNNIFQVVEYSGFDLETLVIDWENFKKVQLAFLKSGVANQDIPQDHVFIAGLLRIAKREKINSIVSGSNFATESILPQYWGYDASDRDQIKDICLKHGAGRAYRKIPTIRLFEQIFINPYIYKIKTFAPLNHIYYSKKFAIEELKKIGWRYYGGKHYESRWTHFFQSYFLPKRFGYDKRLCHLSSLILSNEISRDEALNEINSPLYQDQEIKKDIKFISGKLGIDEKELIGFINETPLRRYTDYKNWETKRENLYRRFFPLIQKIFKNI
tara:strand:- start:1658 stop:2791 length:1134 start_codon:yes stop_codon:yes gene_type:complete